jgi:hypothetical protein
MMEHPSEAGMPIAGVRAKRKIDLHEVNENLALGAVAGNRLPASLKGTRDTPRSSDLC